MKDIKQVCIYCASSTKIHQDYFEATKTIATLLVRKDIKVIYGGGSVGLMGALADKVLELGGKIKGIIPDFMKQVEWDHKGVKDMEVVNSMHERKNNFLIGTDALIALPGGCGTFEELFEAITLNRLGIINMPIVIVNINGYYDPLEQLLNNAISEQFMKENHRTWIFIKNPNEIISAMSAAQTDRINIHDAKV